ncbi:hypothetical protein EJ110_NYTH49030 [Nymphaea thermarum]|nr:hypothetical protein EJ110_NYTH49030 [Nymphaea thermarum]
MDHSKPKPFIFIMHEDYRSYKPGAPLFMSIGPYVAEDTHVLEDRVLVLVLQRINKKKGDVVNALINVGVEAKGCYEGANIPLEGFEDNNEFVTTLVRDGCFVLELLHILATEAHPIRTMAARLSTGNIYPINTTLLRHILLDLFVMRNQIPLIFLQQIHVQLLYQTPFEGMLNSFLSGYFMEDQP